PGHRGNMSDEGPVRGDRQCRMQRDAPDIGPRRVAIGDVPPDIQRELPEPSIGDRADAGEDLEDVLVGQHRADYMCESERVAGIEPARRLWRSRLLPLQHTRARFNATRRST